MKHRIYTVIRYVFGVAIAFFGIGNFFQFLPQHQFSEEAERLMLAFANSGYVLQSVGLTQFLLGVALLLNQFIPLALLIFAPVAMNVLLFHLFLDIKGVLMAMPTIGVTIFLFVYHKIHFISFLKANSHEQI